MTDFTVEIHSRSQHISSAVVRREFDALASAIVFGLPIVGIDPDAIGDVYVEKIDPAPGDGWVIVMRVRTDQLRHAASVAAVAAHIQDVDAISVSRTDRYGSGDNL